MSVIASLRPSRWPLLARTRAIGPTPSREPRETVGLVGGSVRIADGPIREVIRAAVLSCYGVTGLTAPVGAGRRLARRFRRADRAGERAIAVAVILAAKVSLRVDD